MFSKKRVQVVPTIKDIAKGNSIWCITLQMIWNDFQYGTLNNNFLYNKNNVMVNNLVESNVDNNSINEDDYYKVVGKATEKLKKEIKKALKKKFNEKSDIIDALSFDKDENTNKMLFYTMLKKIFKFKTAFEEMGKGAFGNLNNNYKVKYFGIKQNSVIYNKLEEQVEVMFYNTNNDYAVRLSASNDNDIILYKNADSKPFEDIYNEIIAKTKNSEKQFFRKNDILKIPEIKVNVEKDYEELSNEIFTRNSDNMQYSIAKILQTVNFELDKSGGKVKSEAAMQMFESAMFIKEEKREYNFDNTFYLFLTERNKPIPYFAMRIEDME